MNINKESSYIRGLLDGFELDGNKKEVKLFNLMIGLIDEMADRITALEADNAELREYVEELDHDLGEVETELYDCDDDYEYDDEYEDEDEEEFEDDSEYYELECPSCGEVICFDDSLDPESLVCPACGEPVGDVEICDGECENCEKKDCEEE